MSRFVASQHLARAHLAVCALILAWDLWTASRTAQLRGATRFLSFLSALIGLLLVPALVVLLTSTSLLAGRTLVSIAWVWPATVLLVAVQAVYATRHHLTPAAVAIPIALYDVVLVALYGARWAVATGWNPGGSLLALVAADRAAIAFAAQPLALVKPWYLFPPILAPVTPGRRGMATVGRGALAALAAGWGTLLLVAVPTGGRAVRSYDRYAHVRIEERSDSGFAVGLKIFPTLRAAPAPLSVAADLALADSLGVGALSVYVAPSGARGVVLDSIGHALEDSRGDRTLIVALDLPSPAALPAARRRAWFRARAADAARIARRLSPDYVVPVVAPASISGRPPHAMSASDWITYLATAADAVHRGAPGVRVMVHVGGITPMDSAIFAWASSGAAPVDAVAISLFPGLVGATPLDARMRAADAWMHAAPVTKPLWVLEAGAFPLAHGDASQSLAIRGELAWATSRPNVRGIVIYEASDYDAPLGLRAAGGGVRAAAAVVRAGVRSQEAGGRDSAAAPLPPES